MISPEGVAAARRQLGRQLAALRKAAGYRTQHEFAPLTFYTRSTLANAETGRQRTGRAFWQRCDELLCTGGVLADGYDRIEAMVAQQQEETAQSLQVDNPAGSLSSLPGGCELSWSVDLGEALGEAVGLWGHEPIAGDGESLDVAAARGVALRWLVAPPDSALPQRGVRRVGQADVHRLRAVRHTLKAVDNAHGGGTALPMAVAYLRREVEPLLGGSYTDSTGRALLGAVGELSLDVGWMAYDSASHRSGARYMTQALRLSHAAGDRLFGGRVMAAMSHQALHLGQVRLAVDLARAAQLGTGQGAPPRARAMLAAMEAMAQAADRNLGGATAALTIAENALARAGAGDDEPDWLDFDEGGLWGHAARAYRYLDHGGACERHAARATALCQQSHGRTRAQRQAILAAGQLRCGNAEQAADTGIEVVAAAWTLTSRHVDQEIATLARAVQRTGSRAASCTEFLDQARAYLSARAAS